jgi:hypothetical protein
VEVERQHRALQNLEKSVDRKLHVLDEDQGIGQDQELANTRRTAGVVGSAGEQILAVGGSLFGAESTGMIVGQTQDVVVEMQVVAVGQTQDVEVEILIVAAEQTQAVVGRTRVAAVVEILIVAVGQTHVVVVAAVENTQVDVLECAPHQKQRWLIPQIAGR